MNLENSDEEYNGSQPEMCYWNNWIPKNDTVNTDVNDKYISKRSQLNLIPQSEINMSQAIPVETENKATPSSLGKTNVRNEIKLLEEKRKYVERTENLRFMNKGVFHSHESKRNKMFDCSLCGEDDALECNNSEDKFNINKDWGKRIELHNILHVGDGEKVWNIISRGIFAEIKLWRNEYGNICCKATGKITVKGVSEKSLIEINTGENLRKMLNLSSIQWSALCEAVQEKNCSLSFNALNDTDIGKISSLEKLWFFICKRRHFLPNICVLGKLSGAVKLLKELRIIPKLVVMDIRDFKGEEIS